MKIKKGYNLRVVAVCVSIFFLSSTNNLLHATSDNKTSLRTNLMTDGINRDDDNQRLRDAAACIILDKTPSPKDGFAEEGDIKIGKAFAVAKRGDFEEALRLVMEGLLDDVYVVDIETAIGVLNSIVAYHGVNTEKGRKVQGLLDIVTKHQKATDQGEMKTELRQAVEAVREIARERSIDLAGETGPKQAVEEGLVAVGLSRKDNFTEVESIDINKPFSQMGFEELIWWYKAFMFSLQVSFSEADEQRNEVIDLLEQKYIPMKDRIGTTSFFMWDKRIFHREVVIPVEMYKQIYREEPPLLAQIEELREQLKKERLREIDMDIPIEERSNLQRKYIANLMAVIQEFNRARKDLDGKTLFEVTYDRRASDAKWQPEGTDDGKWSKDSNYSPDVLLRTPSLLTKADVSIIQKVGIEPPASERETGIKTNLGPFDPSVYLNAKWDQRDSVVRALQRGSLGRDKQTNFFVDFMIATLRELDKIAGERRGYQLLDSVILLDEFQSALDEQKLGIILYQGEGDDGIQEILCFSQDTGEILASSAQESGTIKKNLVPVALYPHYLMFEDDTGIVQPLPGIINRGAVKESIRIWINTNFPSLASSKDITIMPFAPSGCRIGRYIKVMVDDIAHYVVGLNAQGEPVEVYPMDWENKPNVVPRVGFLVMENLGAHNMSGQRVVDLGTGDFAFYAIRAAWLGASSAVGIEYDLSRVENAKRIAERTRQNVEILQGSWYEPIQGRQFDVIVTNPPYSPIPESAEQSDIADSGGPDGREHIDHIIERSINYLSEQGRLIIHHGAFLGVEERQNASSPCTFEKMKEVGLEPKVLARYWLRASGHFVETLPYIKTIYPDIELIKIGEDWYYETVVIEGKLTAGPRSYRSTATPASPATEATQSLTAQINAGHTTFSDSKAVPVLFDGRGRIFNRLNELGDKLELEAAVDDFSSTELARLEANEVAVVVVITREEEQTLREHLEDRAVILNLGTLEEDTDTYNYFNALFGTDDYLHAMTEAGLYFEDTLRLDQLKQHLDKA